MTKENFIKKFNKSLNQTMEFARTLVIDELPDQYKFNLYRADLRYFKKRLEIDEVVNELYQNGKVPKWINIGVIKVDDGYTIIKCEYSDTFYDDDNLLQFPNDPLSPFSITGPARPDNQKEKFKLPKFDEEKNLVTKD
ncbi:hypothetical protein KKF32_03975 [Patescibacteria group bacterium]|nr:hypothetical protein [Patescibacteria group bacterium]